MLLEFAYFVRIRCWASVRRVGKHHECVWRSNCTRILHACAEIEERNLLDIRISRVRSGDQSVEIERVARITRSSALVECGVEDSIAKLIYWFSGIPLQVIGVSIA
jgi:hypothetical protein